VELVLGVNVLDLGGGGEIAVRKERRILGIAIGTAKGEKMICQGKKGKDEVNVQKGKQIQCKNEAFGAMGKEVRGGGWRGWG